MTKARLFLVAAALLATVLATVALGSAATNSKSTLKASLNAGQEVPKPVGVPRGASGRFTGTLAGHTVTWRLTFKHLSGKATAAHIHLGKRGKPGPVKVSLCGPCKSGAHGSATVTTNLANAIKAGKTYVNVHTLKNANGEIRGQIKAS
jgi:hypothetical protein